MAPAGYEWVRVDAVSDEFNGNSLDRDKWLNDHPYWNGREPSQFLPANVSVGGGNLQLKSTVANRSQNGNWVHSAAVTSNTKVGQGYYEARVKALELGEMARHARTATFAENWKSILATDGSLGFAVLLAGLAIIVWWGWAGWILIALGLMYVGLVFRRFLQWRWIRKQAGLD